MRKAWRHMLVLVPAALMASGCAGPREVAPALDVNVRQVAPDRVDAMLAQAEADLAERRLQNALSGFSAVLKAVPDNLRARAGIAETYLAMGQGDLALKAYAAWPAEEAEQPHILQGRGIASLLTGSAELAEPPLYKAVEADPSLWRSWNALGLIHDRKRDWAEADRCYERATQANPKAAESYNNWGYSMLQRGDYARSIPLLQTALQNDAALEAARNNLALAGALQGRYEGALAAVPADTMPVALNNVGYAALLRGDYSSAETYLTRAVQTSPRHFERAYENLRWLKYVRGGGTGGAEAPFDAAKASPKPQVRTR